MNLDQKEELYADFCVIGAGSGGLSFAAGAVQMGASVILVEAKKMGGDCLNTGCVPSKSLLAAAKLGHLINDSHRFGWSVKNPTLDFKQVHKHIHKVIKKIAPQDSVERFEKLGVKVILEEGKFLNETTLITPNHIIRAKRYIIASGSKPFIPPIEGLSSVPYLTNETIFDLKTLPDHLVVIGGGPIGIEMAQAFHRLGSKVTVLEAFTALPKDDPELTTILKNSLKSEGIDIQEQVKISTLGKTKKGIEIQIEGQPPLLASHILVATGRKASKSSLNLEAAKVDLTPKGILVNEMLRTSNHRIFAIGDCIGGYQFTQVANYHAGLAIRNSIFSLRSRVQTISIPWVTYTDPELAHVGYLESQLQEQNIKYRALKLSFDANDRAQAEGKPEGQIKVLVSPRGHILGASILGNQAGELIFPWVMAIQNKLKISALANTIAPYPTLSDINKRVAGSFYTDTLFGSRMKKIVKFLMGIRR